MLPGTCSFTLDKITQTLHLQAHGQRCMLPNAADMQRAEMPAGVQKRFDI